MLLKLYGVSASISRRDSSADSRNYPKKNNQEMIVAISGLHAECSMPITVKGPKADGIGGYS